MDDFTRAYLECALWASLDPDSDEPLDGLYTVEDFSPEAVKQAEDDCADFQMAQSDLLDATGAHPGQGGHDFFLTRNHHGAGFWDRGYGEVGEKLSKACAPYGEAVVYPGDDGQLHFL